jgi:hypothetical protein
MAEWVALLLAAMTTLGIVGLVLAPAWWPALRDHQRRTAQQRTAIQQFVVAVERGDFTTAEDAIARLVDRPHQRGDPPAPRTPP